MARSDSTQLNKYLSQIETKIKVHESYPFRIIGIYIDGKIIFNIFTHHI